MPANRSADSEVNLQGLEFNYKEICSPTAVENHRIAIQARLTEEQARLAAEAKLLQEKRRANEAKFAAAVDSSKELWSRLEKLLVEASSSCFSAISQLSQGDFICAGSYPAFLIAKQLAKISRDYEPVQLKFNDIDIYYGSFGNGELKRTRCTWTKIENISSEVNLIKCENLSTDYLVDNFDINAVAVCVHAKVLNKKVSSVL